jgi:hypothetical protein
VPSTAEAAAAAAEQKRIASVGIKAHGGRGVVDLDVAR